MSYVAPFDVVQFVNQEGPIVFESWVEGAVIGVVHTADRDIYEVEIVDPLSGRTVCICYFREDQLKLVKKYPPSEQNEE